MINKDAEVLIEVKTLKNISLYTKASLRELLKMYKQWMMYHLL